MDDFAVGDLVVEPLEVRQLEPADGANRRIQRLARCPFLPRSTKRTTQRTQRPQHLRPIEALTLTVLAKAHDQIMPRSSDAVNAHHAGRSPRRMC